MPGPITVRPLLLPAPSSNNGWVKHFLNKLVWIKQHWDMDICIAPFSGTVLYSATMAVNIPPGMDIAVRCYWEILALIRDVTITKGK